MADPREHTTQDPYVNPEVQHEPGEPVPAPAPDPNDAPEWPEGQVPPEEQSDG